MTCGTLQTTLEVGAARPSVDGRSVLLLEILGGFGPSIQATQNMAWMKEWTVRPAYPMTHTDRPIQRPSERSP
jgi:hypothetical protein